MNAIELLKRDALSRRNAKILAAKREYYKELKAIKSLQYKLGINQPGRPRKIVVNEDPTLKAATVAKQILMEGKRLTLRELTLEVQRRGCRTGDDYRTASHAVNSGLHHSRWQFRRDAEGRWALVS